MLMDLDHSSIGYRIRTARLNSGLTQKQLAFQVHVTSPYLATVERGLKNASEALLKRIAAVTEAPLEWLIDGVGVPNMPMGQYDADILSGILTRNVLGMSLNDAIAGGYAYMVQQSFNQEAFCILSAGENHEQVFDAFHGCERMSVDKLDASFCNYIGGMVFASAYTSNSTKHTYVVTSPAAFNHISHPMPLLNANVSVLLIDPDKKTIVREYPVSQNQSQAVTSMVLQ